MVQDLQYGTAALCSRSLQDDVSDCVISLWLFYLQSMQMTGLEAVQKQEDRPIEATIPAPQLQLASSHKA